MVLRGHWFMPTMTLQTLSYINQSIQIHSLWIKNKPKNKNIPTLSFRILAFTLKEVESASSLFTTNYGKKSKHDSVIPTSPTAQDWGTLTVRYFQKNSPPQKFHQRRECVEVTLWGERVIKRRTSYYDTEGPVQDFVTSRDTNKAALFFKTNPLKGRLAA